MAKRKTKKEKKRLVLISLTIVGLLICLFASLYSDFMKVMDNKKQTALLTKEYESLLEEQEQLASEVLKMQNPDYIARYAKEKFMYSSKEEVIVRID